MASAAYVWLVAGIESKRASSTSGWTDHGRHLHRAAVTFAANESLLRHVFLCHIWSSVIDTEVHVSYRVLLLELEENVRDSV